MTILEIICHIGIQQVRKFIHLRHALLHLIYHCTDFPAFWLAVFQSGIIAYNNEIIYNLYKFQPCMHILKMCEILSASQNKTIGIE